MLDKTNKYLSDKEGQTKEAMSSSSKEVIIGILTRAAEDRKFLAQLAENPSKVLHTFELTEEARAALANGNLKKIESWVGNLDEHLKTWINVRLAQDKW